MANRGRAGWAEVRTPAVPASGPAGGPAPTVSWRARAPGAGAGARPATDFSTENCTGGNCDRRGEYLTAATDLLIDDLQDMVAAWGPDGEAREGLLGGDPDAGIAAMLTGMGSLSYGELAGERIKLGLMLHDPEEEQDCFSDNTHNSHYRSEEHTS